MNTDPWKQVTVVIVVHNSAAVIGPCLQSVTRAARIVVVDNASTDDTIEVARKTLDSVVVVENSLNMGFGTANNIGFERSETPFTLLLNPDAIVTDGAIEHLLAAAEIYPDAAVVAPVLMSPEGEAELYVMGLNETSHHRWLVPPDGDISTGFIMGAAMLWRMDAWTRVGGFDENIFLYGEDTDIALRTRALGYSLVVTPGAVVRHLGGQSEPPSRTTRWRKDWHMTWGHLYVKTRHGEGEQARAEARRIALRHGLKAFFYCLVIRPQRMLGNYAKAHAALTFLAGGRSWPGRSG